MRGRPRKDCSRNKVMRIRCDDEDIKKLSYICEKRGLTMSQAFRKALDIYYIMTKFNMDSVYN